ncbi:uncharacterized protein PHACADRAFT_265835 [Phanerochaete carnosa HHB-10118-sp]|uniref:Uncharacterized protein n=1 Tax=Phanerochaete carnosa (strain HHB-10118-sp) TaxID=650164 RepID=K5VQS1_PHACS|nr:uncharacterized protein PHACADRAFT_265835 [Phanerochaete carnosa HHB-10118-sp]EKM49095.1 hypothetical protein PHACADRAFT_265835 [Phanerochaete carnosa HHB-10118-sp]
MPEPSTQSARIIFGPRVQSLQEGVDDAPVQITKGTCKHNSIIELQDITHLQVTIHASCRTSAAPLAPSHALTNHSLSA